MVLLMACRFTDLKIIVLIFAKNFLNNPCIIQAFKRYLELPVCFIVKPWTSKLLRKVKFHTVNLNTHNVSQWRRKDACFLGFWSMRNEFIASICWTSAFRGAICLGIDGGRSLGSDSHLGKLFEVKSSFANGKFRIFVR